MEVDGGFRNEISAIWLAYDSCHVYFSITILHASSRVGGLRRIRHAERATNRTAEFTSTHHSSAGFKVPKSRISPQQTDNEQMNWQEFNQPFEGPTLLTQCQTA